MNNDDKNNNENGKSIFCATREKIGHANQWG